MDDEALAEETNHQEVPEDIYSVAASEVASVLRAAHDAALEMTQRAEQEAARIREEAHAESRRLRRQAEEQALAIRAEARSRLEAEVEIHRQEIDRSMEERTAAAETEWREKLAQLEGETVAPIRAALGRMQVDAAELERSLQAATQRLSPELGTGGSEPPSGPGL